MKSSDTLGFDAYIALLLVGEPKTGKTCVSFAFPSPFILNVDKNLDGPRRRAPGKKFFHDDPVYDKDGKELPEEKRYDRAMELLKEAFASPDVKTIVISSLSGLADYLCAKVLKEAERNEGKKLDKLRIQDYMTVKDLLARLATFLRVAAKSKHVIVEAHQKADKDDATQAIRYSLNIPGQQAQNWGSYFTDVWATTATPAGQGKTKFEIRTKPTGFHVSLGTSLAMPPAIDITDKSPDEVWSLLSPHLSIAQSTKK